MTAFYILRSRVFLVQFHWSICKVHKNLIKYENVKNVESIANRRFKSVIKHFYGWLMSSRSWAPICKKITHGLIRFVCIYACIWLIFINVLVCLPLMLFWLSIEIHRNKIHGNRLLHADAYRMSSTYSFRIENDSTRSPQI